MAFSRSLLFKDDVLFVLGLVLGVLAGGLVIALALLPIFLGWHGIFLHGG